MENDREAVVYKGKTARKLTTTRWKSKKQLQKGVRFGSRIAAGSGLADFPSKEKGRCRRPKLDSYHFFWHLWILFCYTSICCCGVGGWVRAHWWTNWAWNPSAMECGGAEDWGPPLVSQYIMIDNRRVFTTSSRIRPRTVDSSIHTTVSVDF